MQPPRKPPLFPYTTLFRSRSLAPDPQVLLMDEPFAALDALTRDQLYDDIQRIWHDSRKTIVFVTHNVREAVCLGEDRKSTRLNSSHVETSYAVFCLKKKMAANAVLITFLLLISNALDGFANAAEALIGSAVGRNSRRRFMVVFRCALRWSLWGSLLLTILCIAGGRSLIALLTGIEEVRTTAWQYLPWLWLLPFASVWCFLFFFFNDAATPEIYTLSLHDALPICGSGRPPYAQRNGAGRAGRRRPALPARRCRQSTRDRS